MNKYELAASEVDKLLKDKTWLTKEECYDALGRAGFQTDEIDNIVEGLRVVCPRAFMEMQ